MRGVRGVAAASLVAALSAAVSAAWAGNEPSGREGPHYLLFASTDLWRHGGFSHGGLLAAPEGLDREGFVLKVMFSGGLYRYTSGALRNAEVTGRQLAAAILPGWRFIRHGTILTVFAGLDLQEHRLTPDDISAGLRGGYVGARTGFELWYEPTPETMVAADASVSSIGPSYSARLAVGWRLFDWFYVGPEAQGFAAGSNYQQYRAGIHLTGFKTHIVEWSASAGWAGDSDRRSSVYGRLGILARR